LVSASYLYSDGNGSHFLDQESYETHTLAEEVMGNALDFLTGGALVELLKYNGNPIGLELPVSLSWRLRPRNRGAGRLVERQREPSQPRWRPVWRSAFRSSSKKVKR